MDLALTFKTAPTAAKVLFMPEVESKTDVGRCDGVSVRIATSYYITSLQPYKNRSRYPIPLRPRPISFHFEGPKGGCNATVPGSCRFTPRLGCNECATQDHNYSAISPPAKHL